MADLQVNMTLRAYDHLTPLFLGDVPTPGIKLNLDHRAPMTSAFPEGLAAAFDLRPAQPNEYAA